MESNLGLRFIAIFLVVGLAALFIGLFDFNYGIDLKGGYTVTYGLEQEADDPDPESNQAANFIPSNAVDNTIRVMVKRVNRLGLLDIKFIPEGEDRIKVQIPGADQAEAERIKEILTKLGELELRIVATDAELSRAGINVAAETTRREAMEAAAAEAFAQGRAPVNYTGPETGDFAWYYMENRDPNAQPGEPPAGPGLFVKTAPDQGIAGSEIGSVYPDMDGKTGLPAVGFKVKAQARGDFAKLTRSNVGRQLAIVLNERIATAPNIESELSGASVITGGPGGYKNDEVEDLIATLKSGSLDFKPKLLSEDLIGPTLGEDAIKRGGFAMLIGLIAVLIFMLIYYRVAGIIANIALLLTILIMAGALLLFGATLTLPGIAGIVLTVGMAVDANILIFERIREERDKGKTLAQSVRNGYDQAFRAIFDSNVTTLATAIILVTVGTEVIKGFGVTLAIGIVASMFSALFATKTIFIWLISKGVLKDLTMMKIIGVPKVEFLRYSGTTTVLSTILIIAGLALFFMKGDEKYSIDFTGGGVVQVALKEAITIDEMKNTVSSLQENGQAKYPDAEVVSILVPGQPRGSSTKFEVSSKLDDADATELKNDLVAALAGNLLPEGIRNFEVIAADDESVDESLRGGLRFLLTLPDDVTEEQIRERLGAVNLAADSLAIEAEGGAAAGWSTWRVMGSPTRGDYDESEFNHDVRVAFINNSSPIDFPEPIPKATTVGKVVAKDLKNKAIIAMFLSLLFMIYYVRIRFHEYRYGLAAAVCLLHDVIVTLGVCVLFNSLGIIDVKISYAIIAVFLTIVGYSLNDTIVIFDRVRENTPRAKGSVADTINLSINQTLSRTILTSVTTLFVVVVLLVVNYGQQSQLEGFAFALFIGIISGTYSTIFVASPVVVKLGAYLDKKASEAANTTNPAKAPV